MARPALARATVITAALLVGALGARVAGGSLAVAYTAVAGTPPSAAVWAFGGPARQAPALLFRDDHPSLERRPPASVFLQGDFGMATWSRLPARFAHPGDALPEGGPPGASGLPPSLALTAAALEPPPLLFPPPIAGLDGLGPPASLFRPRPCRARAVNFVRYGAESDTFVMTTCDGAVAPGALDRLSAAMRPPDVERPALPLPETPDPAAPAGEWVTGVRLVEPRLVWLLQTIAANFPWKPIYIMSGYRRGAHSGLHGYARAVDLFVMGVANDRVYRECRRFHDVGCGYYPNNKFVHVDVRRQGAGRVYWVDTAAPGEESHYVDTWPGVEAGGGGYAGDE